MIRKLIIVMLALATCLICAISWASRTKKLDHFLSISARLGYHFIADNGWLIAKRWERLPQHARMHPSRLTTYPGVKLQSGSGVEGMYAGQEMLGFHTSSVAVRPVIMLILFAAYPTIAFIRGPLRRYRRRKRGLCVTCGYDLRGSPDRCPECGAEAEAK